MCDGRLVRDPGTTLYPTVTGGLRLIPPRGHLAGGSLRETRAGRVELDAAFHCVPRSPGAVHAVAHHVVVQVRSGVGLRFTSLDGRSSGDLDDQVALCAFGEPGNPALTWVQTGHFRPERVLRFDGRDEVIDLDLRDAGSNERFADAGEPWWVDSRSEVTARYAGSGVYLRPARFSNDEIIYDSPDTSVSYVEWMRGKPHIRLVGATVQFRTYLYRRPGGYQGLAPLDPLALVEWWYTESFERARPEDEPRRTGASVRVQWILANPPEPLRLDDAIRAFQQR